MEIEIRADGTGVLNSHFEMTDLDGQSYEFSYPMEMTVSLSEIPYVLVASDAETGEEITMRCTPTEADLLSCSYTLNEPNSPEGTLHFLKAP